MENFKIKSLANTNEVSDLKYYTYIWIINTRAMTTKLTLTINEKVISSAKVYAQKSGKSLSNLVENYLKSISSNEGDESNLSPKIQKLLGSVKLPADFNYKTDLSIALSKKHNK